MICKVYKWSHIIKDSISHLDYKQQKEGKKEKGKPRSKYFIEVRFSIQIAIIRVIWWLLLLITGGQWIYLTSEKYSIKF